MKFNPLNYPILFSAPDRLELTSVWVGHIPFAMLLTELLQPRMFVELGSHWGESYCAVCQAVKTLKIGTRCAAIDTWKGDPHACFYGEDVYNDLKQHHDARYTAFSRMIRADFDSAVGQFEDGSIDLLHIDGYHTYDAVRHDYETWRNKVSDRGVILFHDTEIRHRDFGVWKFWEEIDGQYPNFRFEHSCGLGVLAVGKNVPYAVLEFIEEANSAPVQFRKLFETLGANIERAKFVKGMLAWAMQSQNMVNEWKRITGRPIDPRTQDVSRAIAEPIAHVRGLTQDIHAILNTEIGLRQMMQQYLAPPPQQQPAVQPPQRSARAA